MGTAGAIEQLERVTHLQSNANATMVELQAGLADVRVLRSFFDSAEANFARRIAAGSSFPEKDVAEAAGGTLNDASRILERTRTLDAAPEMAAALDAGRISGSHVDVLSRAAKHLDDKLSVVLFDKVANLVDVAAVATVPDFAKRLRDEVSRILADDGVARLERQRRSTALSSWVDDEGMWRVSGKFDPVTGIRLAATLRPTRVRRGHRRIAESGSGWTPPNQSPQSRRPGSRGRTRHHRVQHERGQHERGPHRRRFDPDISCVRDVAYSCRSTQRRACRTTRQ